MMGTESTNRWIDSNNSALSKVINNRIFSIYTQNTKKLRNIGNSGRFTAGKGTGKGARLLFTGCKLVRGVGYYLQ